MIEKWMEVDGKLYLVQKEETDNVTSYSLDRGDTWATTMVEAFLLAKESGGLILAPTLDGPEQQDESGEAFIVELVSAISSLTEGETLKIHRGPSQLIVVKEEVIAAVRPSAIEEMGGSPEESRGG